jgi:tRNA dimethylallyltransferase
MKPPRIVAVVGATATGKTAVGERLAAGLGGEVVCADSRQVFRELEIGTGKPAPAQRSVLPHHLFEALSLASLPADSVAPATGEAQGRATAGWYAAAAREVCAQIHARGRLPILVGGSGLYLRAARRGLAPMPPADPAVRERLRAELESVGPEALHQRLAQLDPEAADRLDPRDRQRVARALEVIESTGRPLSWWHGRRESHRASGAWRIFELQVCAAEASAVIRDRTRWMFEHGLLEETAALVAAGQGAALASLHAVGYDEAMACIAGELTTAAAEERTTRRTLQLAKRQRTWFRHQEDGERIAAASRAPEDIAAQIEAGLGGSG